MTSTRWSRHLGLDRFERGNGYDEYALGHWTYRQ